MQVFEKCDDLSETEIILFTKNGYVCVDTETTGLNYINDNLCTIQLFCEDYSVLIKFDRSVDYTNLKQLLMSNEVLKIFHNAVFDVSFLMKNLELDVFGKLVCTKISSKLVNGIHHNNSLKPLLKEYLNVEINKKEQLSDWSKERLSLSQKEYAVNDVKYLRFLWTALYQQLKENNLTEIAFSCFEFVSNYKRLTDRGIENIFAY